MKADPRDQKNTSRGKRLTVDLPSGTLAALKIYVAQRETTIREVVTSLLIKEIKGDAR